MRLRWWLSAPLIALLALGAACSSDGDGDATATAAATAVATEPATAAAATTAAAAAYPVTVTDQLGNAVTIEAAPQRIVALSPTAVELVYAVGGTVVGRSASADYPAAATSATDVGTAYQPSLETILSLNADLVIADKVIHAQPQLQAALAGLSMPVLYLGADSYADVLDALALIGAALDARAQADAAIAAIATALTDAQEQIGDAEVSAVVLIADRDQTLYAAKANSYAGDLLAQAGITNAAADLPDAGPFPGYAAVAPETLLQFDPDFIFTITPAPEPAPRLSTVIAMIPPFAGLAAVRDGQVVELDLVLFLQSPGPRVVDAIDALARTVSGAAAP